jgi:hypothetical protein
MNSSTRIGESGAGPHSDRVKTKPVDSKILMFSMCIHLMECYIVNSIERLAMNTLYVYIHIVINNLLKLW